MNILFVKFKEVLYSIIPISLIVITLNFTLTPLDHFTMIRFLIGVLCIIIGLTLFLTGVDTGITPIGNYMGTTLAKTNKLYVVGASGIILGFFVSIAEPDLHILASQVESVTSGIISKGIIVVVVSVGIAVMLAIGLIRIVYNVPLYKILMVLYGIIFIISLSTSREFLAISFDASGATTGALTVPFIMALALGVSKLKKDSKSSEKDSFGLVAIASTGAIIAVMIMSILSKTDKISGSLPYEEIKQPSIIEPFLHEIPKLTMEILIALLPIAIIFILSNYISLHLTAKRIRSIFFGIFFTFIGLVLFLVGVNAGFMEVGTAIGIKIASMDNKIYVVIIGFLLGLVTILAEPAVHVLTHQIEDVTSAYVNRKIVLFTLCIGVGSAVALSMIRIMIPELQLWHYLLPGYIISLGLMFIVPKIFVGIAFDSGGVASGPMTATFILAYAHGVAEAIEEADVLVDGFGMISMVALTPIIALQIMGLIFKIKSRRKGVD